MDEILTKQEFCKRFRIGRDEFRELYKDTTFSSWWRENGKGKKKTCRLADAEKWYESGLNRNKAKAL